MLYPLGTWVKKGDEDRPILNWVRNQSFVQDGLAGASSDARCCATIYGGVYDVNLTRVW